jgi:hypothetical protein
VAILARRLLLPLGIGLVLASRLAAQAEPSASATEIRAAYLLNFARYVEWPASAIGAATAPLVICVVESDPMQEALHRVADGRTVNGHPVRVAVVRSREDPTRCHVAYIDPAAGPTGRSLQAAWASQPVLTVGEGEEFLANGGMVGFVPLNETVRFAINQPAANQAGLRVSSRVLALAVRR